MAYRLGVGLGTTCTAAVIAENGQVSSIVALGDSAAVVPPAAYSSR
jgi:hypothetical protein